MGVLLGAHPKVSKELGEITKIVKVFAVSVMLTVMSVQLAFASHVVRGAPVNGKDFGACACNWVSNVNWEVTLYFVTVDGDDLDSQVFTGIGLGALKQLLGSGPGTGQVTQDVIGFAKSLFGERAGEDAGEVLGDITCERWVLEFEVVVI